MYFFACAFFFFFFQAEDGIRDYKVTGVQTCALPICQPRCEGKQVEQAAAGERRFQRCILSIVILYAASCRLCPPLRRGPACVLLRPTRLEILRITRYRKSPQRCGWRAS